VTNIETFDARKELIMSDQEQRNIELVKKGYEAFSAGDGETMMSLFDDNVEWVQPGDSTISGTYHGKAELGEYLSRLAEKSVTVKLKRILADGDTVVALTDVAVGDERGQDADVFTLRDGKTVRVQVHTDTALMERIYGRKKVAAG
jgi:ketosteroid isomerase-like protein